MMLNVGSFENILKCTVIELRDRMVFVKYLLHRTHDIGKYNEKKFEYTFPFIQTVICER